MYRQKLCLNLMSPTKMALTAQIKLFRDIGFDGFFADYGDDMAALRSTANETGMLFHSVHAPISKMDAMWEMDERTDSAVGELIDCVQQCADHGAPIMIIHSFIGFEKHSPTQMGIDMFGKVVSEAAKCGVKLAFENIEGEEYLAAVMDAFRNEAHVGFCWDAGHEMCYNHSKDMLALYGDRLISTHLNDNLGIRALIGDITWLDDLHLLPFDGINDWADSMKRLNKCGFDGPLTFELTFRSKPGRHENDAYDRMDFAEYIAEAYKRACRVAKLKMQD